MAVVSLYSLRQSNSSAGRFRGRKEPFKAEKIADLFVRYGEFTELTAGLLNTLVDRITVSEPYVEDGRFKQDVTIYYRHIGAFGAVQHDATRFYKSEKCTQASQKRAARKMDERKEAVKIEATKDGLILPTEEISVRSLQSKERTKCTNACRLMLPLKAKNWAQKQPIDRSEARFHIFCPFFAQNARKNLFCLGRQKRFLLWSSGE